jgi:hypothetical protein
MGNGNTVFPCFHPILHGAFKHEGEEEKSHRAASLRKKKLLFSSITFLISEGAYEPNYRANLAVGLLAILSDPHRIVGNR